MQENDEREQPVEFLYALVNESMPGYIKIGRTNSVEKRVEELSGHSGVPLPFKVEFVVQVANARAAEEAMQVIFAPHRVSASREFFTAPLDSIIAAMQLTGLPVPLDSIEERPLRDPRKPSPLAFTKVEAQNYLLQALAEGQDVSLDDLAHIWSVDSSTVCRWVTEWELRGIIQPRQMVGRRKLFTVVK